MIAPIIIDREQEQTRTTVPVSRSMRAAAHFNSTCGTILNWSRNSAGYQPRRTRAGGSDDRLPRRAGIPQRPQFLPAIHFPIRRPPSADTHGLINAFLPADLRGFNSVWPFKAARRLIRTFLSIAIQLRQKSFRGCAQALHFNTFCRIVRLSWSVGRTPTNHKETRKCPTMQWRNPT